MRRAAEGVYTDEAGPAVAARLREAGYAVEDPVVVPDGLDDVTSALQDAVAAADLVVTTGGTGISPTDVTPEATLMVVEREVPGIGEAMRAASRQVTPLAALSRAVAGIRGQSLVLNLPGSPKAALENLAAVQGILPHALDQMAGGDH